MTVVAPEKVGATAEARRGKLFARRGWDLRSTRWGESNVAAAAPDSERSTATSGAGDGHATIDKPGPRARLDGLTGLRFFAALAVFAFHAKVFLVGTRFSGLFDLASPGMVGVSFFFVLSGFVLTWSWRPRPYLQYIRRRLARIVPATWVAGLFALTTLATHRDALESVPTLLSVPLLHAWWPGVHIDSTPLPATWSLSVELFFYLLFPAVLLGARRLPLAARKPAMLGLVAAIVAWAALNPTNGFTNTWAVYYSPAARLLEFTLGILLALEVADRRWPRVPPLVALGAVAVGWELCLHVPPQYQFVACTIVPFVLLIGAVAQRDASGTRTWVGHPVLEALGRWSFAFYLVHPTVVRLIGYAGKKGFPVHGVPAIGLALAVAIGGAYCLYTFVERPAERRLGATPFVQARQPEDVTPAAN
jgi:peptidoglycan/LPS O-acetylase OafA/YrhL